MKTCETCRFWTGPIAAVWEYHPNHKGRGQCRRHAPQTQWHYQGRDGMMHTFPFPTVAKEMWRGEHSQQEPYMKTTVTVRGNRSEWGIPSDLSDEAISDMRADGLQVDVVVNTIPAIVADLGLARVWCFFQDLLNFRNPIS